MNLISATSSLLFLCAVSLGSVVQAEQRPTLDDVPQQQDSKTLSSYVAEVLKPMPAEPYWYVQTSVYTKHFTPRSDHNNNQELIGLERHTENSYLMGGATFLHSYNQRTYYGYVGKRFDFVGTPFYGKVTAGLLYGYKGEYRDKIPFNRFEIAPAIVPSLGMKYQRLGVEVVLLGAAATMINIGFEL